MSSLAAVGAEVTHPITGTPAAAAAWSAVRTTGSVRDRIHTATAPSTRAVTAASAPRRMRSKRCSARFGRGGDDRGVHLLTVLPGGRLQRFGVVDELGGECVSQQPCLCR